MDETFTDAMNGLKVLLIESFDGNRAEVWTTCGFGNRGGIVAVVLRSLTKGDDVLRRDEHHGVTECRELPRPVLRTRAGLKSNGAAWEIGEKEQHFIAVQTLMQCVLTARVRAAEFERVFRDVDADQSSGHCVHGILLRN